MKELQKRNFTTEDFRKEVENCLYKIKEIGLLKNNERNINNYEFAFNSRQLTTYGTCKTIVPNKKYLITLNLLYVQYGTIEQIRNTIMHEILHSLPNGHGHKGKWKQYANIINSKYSEYHISRTSYSKEYQLALKANIVPNYTLICPIKACVKEIYSELKRKHLKNKFILESSIKEEIGENEFEVLKQYGFIDYIGVVNNIKAYSL